MMTKTKATEAYKVKSSTADVSFGACHNYLQGGLGGKDYLRGLEVLSIIKQATNHTILRKTFLEPVIMNLDGTLYDVLCVEEPNGLSSTLKRGKVPRDYVIGMLEKIKKTDVTAETKYSGNCKSYDIIIEGNEMFLARDIGIKDKLKFNKKTLKKIA